MKFIDELKLNFIGATGLFRVMMVNIFVFIGISLFKLILFLAGYSDIWVLKLIDFISLKSYIPAIALQPWSVISYMFVHEAFFHFLFNMIILFWTGKLFCDFFTSKKLVAVYILGGISGGVFYVTGYNLFPTFADVLLHSRLIGASAGAIAILTAIATWMPNYTVHLFLFGAIRLKWIAIIMVLLYLISIPNGNAGGHFSHIGGAVFGFAYAMGRKNGIDTGKWLEQLLDKIVHLFSFSKKLKMVHSTTGRGTPGKKKAASNQEQIDVILDKISRSGYNSLTSEEKQILFNASKNTDS